MAMPKLGKRSKPADPLDAADPSLALAWEQLRWYARHRDRARRAHQVCEITILVVTAAATLEAALRARPWITAALAAAALVLTGMRKIFDWQENWIAFSDAWTQLRTVINEYRLLPGDQRDEGARQRLVARVNEVVSTDTARWSARRRSLAEHRD